MNYEIEQKAAKIQADNYYQLKKNLEETLPKEIPKPETRDLGV